MLYIINVFGIRQNSLLKSCSICSAISLPPICFQIDTQSSKEQRAHGTARRLPCRRQTFNLTRPQSHNNTHTHKHKNTHTKNAFSHACKWYNEPGYICCFHQHRAERARARAFVFVGIVFVGRLLSPWNVKQNTLHGGSQQYSSVLR